MTRISDRSIARVLTGDIYSNKEDTAKYGAEISSGVKVSLPGDSRQAGTISQIREGLSRIAGYKDRGASTKSFLEFQDDALDKAGEILIRAREIAGQSANETIGAEGRRQMAEEVIQIRDHMVGLANSTYQGRYVFAGAADDQPAYSAATYADPPTGPLASRYVYTTADGASLTREARLTDDVSVRMNTPGNTIFDDAVQGLERLARALQGYATNPATGAPDGTGAAYPAAGGYAQQTVDIRAAIDQLDAAKEGSVQPERVSLGGRLRRLETAESLLSLTKVTSEEALSSLQDTDVAESATRFTQAQTALEASMTVTTRVLRTSILDFL